MFFDDNNIEESSALPLGSGENKIVPKTEGSVGVQPLSTIKTLPKSQIP